MRGKPAQRRQPEPDSKYQSILIAKFINAVMRRGQKATAQRIVYDALDRLEKQSKQKGIDVFNLALKNVAPIVEVRSRRIGGANYQIPVEVKGDRKYALAFRWVLNACREKRGRSMAEKLATELLNASKGEGEAIKKREDVHRMAEANRAFAHFA